MTPGKEIWELCVGEFSRRRLPLRFAALCSIGIVSLGLLGMLAQQAIKDVDLSDEKQRTELNYKGLGIATAVGFVPKETAKQMIEEDVPITVFYGTTIPFAFAWVFLALLGFDYWAAPVSQRTWRYYLPRVRRSSLLLVGVVLLLAASIVAILGTALIVLGITFALFKNPALTPTLYWTGRLALAALLAILPDIGLLCFCGMSSKTSTQALLKFFGYSMLLNFFLQLSRTAAALSSESLLYKFSYVRYLIPKNYLEDYLSLDPQTFAGAAVMSVVISAVFTGAALLVTKRREL